MRHGWSQSLSHSAVPRQSVSVAAVERPPTFRTSTNLVVIDAVVTDEKGRHVRDLTAADFEVVQSGRRREVRQAIYVETGPVESGVARASDVTPPQSVPRARDSGASHSRSWRREARSRRAHRRHRGRRSRPVIREHRVDASDVDEVRERTDAAGRSCRHPARQHRTRSMAGCRSRLSVVNCWSAPAPRRVHQQAWLQLAVRRGADSGQRSRRALEYRDAERAGAFGPLGSAIRIHCTGRSGQFNRIVSGVERTSSRGMRTRNRLPSCVTSYVLV